MQGSVQHPELPQGSHFVHRFWGQDTQLPYNPALPLLQTHNITSASAQMQVPFPHHPTKNGHLIRKKHLRHRCENCTLF